MTDTITRSKLKERLKRMTTPRPSRELADMFKRQGISLKRNNEPVPITHGLIYRLQKEIEQEEKNANQFIRIGVFDLETTALRADIGSLIVASFYDPLTDTMYSNNQIEAGGEEALVEWAVQMYNSFDILVHFNGLAFDKNFLNGSAARLGTTLPEKRYHIDLYHVARYGLKGLLQSNSLANLADFFKLSEQKDHPSKHDWRQANLLTPSAVCRIQERCESDVRMTAELFKKLRPFWLKWKGQW